MNGEERLGGLEFLDGNSVSYQRSDHDSADSRIVVNYIQTATDQQPRLLQHYANVASFVEKRGYLKPFRI